MAQRPMAEVSLGDMTFVRQSFVRNFYTSHKVMSQINLEGTDLFLPNSANMIVESKNGAPTLTQQGRELKISSEQASESVIRVGAFHPYLCYEAVIGGLGENEEAGIAFYPNNGEGRSICITYRDGRIAAVANGDMTVDTALGGDPFPGVGTAEKERRIADARLGRTNSTIAHMRLIDRMDYVDIGAEVGYDRTTVSRRMRTIIDTLNRGG